VTARVLSSAAAILLTLVASAQEAGVKVVATIAVQGALTELEPHLEARAGERVRVVLPKAVVVDGFAGTPLREGKVVAAVQQISELKFSGASNIVPLPDELQVRTIFTAAELAATRRADLAARVIEALTSAEAAAAYERSGVSPLFD
jgi:hypothetical protein